MGEIILPRRGFIIGAALSLFAAPAIVKASNLMAVKPFEVLAATGFERPIDLSTEEFLAQYRSFQKGFLADYRKERDPAKAKAFPVADFASKWAGDHIQRESTNGRAATDDARDQDAERARRAAWRNGGDFAIYKKTVEIRTREWLSNYKDDEPSGIAKAQRFLKEGFTVGWD